ncbi:alpha/beta hydrolase [Planotetraspora sp. A-T 1434]|uniref:alpha/beta hydrolase n=1 Tax=Planotetraspora sp. A-T 1434 TaxID=2979219 RepID=UPI0021C200F6|nr:alpha/beta hydrolase [Planotetraspora sp. A-T 1434]MCT9932186.1 alpha/beta hydrolase [Planotetraspora sp. A-T 1434]
MSFRSPRAELLEFAAAVESGSEPLFEALNAGLPEVEGVASETHTVTGPDGHEIKLYVTRPEGVQGPLPAVYYIHGGGMVISEAAGAGYDRWRRELAATGLVVIGVEFRNGAGKLGPHPYPAGLEDCATGLRWAAAHATELGVSNIVVSGESGGANLALALAIKAKREGFLSTISGVYAQCPYIYGKWALDGEGLPSLAENDGYVLNRDTMQVLAEIYDPGSANIDEATCWPSRATTADLEGLPPHVITVNEVDPLRDEGLDYYRKLLAAGVPTAGWMNMGLSHIAETLVRAALPDVYAANVRGISGFAHSLR